MMDISKLLHNPLSIVGLAIVVTIIAVAADSATRKKSRSHKGRVYMKCIFLTLLVSAIFMYFKPYTSASIVAPVMPADEIFSGDF